MRQLSGVAGIVTLGLTVALVLLGSTLTWRAARQVTRPATTRRGSVARRLVRRSTRPEVAEGVRAAYQTNRGVGLVLASGGAAVGVFVGAVVFGSSLSRVLSTPSAYGWQWDVATIDNYGYGGIELDRVHQSLDGRPDVERWTALGFSTSILLDDEQVPSLLGYDRSSTVDLTVVDGSLPTQDDQVAVGARTARGRDLHVGDTVTVGGYEVDPRSATVSGIVVLPALGPFQSDRTAPGVGLLVPEAMLNADTLALGPTFIGIELRPGVDRATALADLHDDIQSWYPNAINTFDRTTPARPPRSSTPGPSASRRCWPAGCSSSARPSGSWSPSPCRSGPGAATSPSCGCSGSPTTSSGGRCWCRPSPASWGPSSSACPWASRPDGSPGGPSRRGSASSPAPAPRSPGSR